MRTGSEYFSTTYYEETQELLQKLTHQQEYYRLLDVFETVKNIYPDLEWLKRNEKRIQYLSSDWEKCNEKEK